MSLKWIFALVTVLYAINNFAGENDFSKMIEENNRDQIKLAAELQEHLGIDNEKTLKSLTASDAVTNEGFKIKIKSIY